MGEAVLEVRDLRISFATYAGEVQAVRGATFDLRRGETLAIVGESGSGKSVAARSIMRLNPEANTIVRGGEIVFEGEDLLKLSEKRMLDIRGPKIAMVFQDPMTSLDPTMRVGRQIIESLKQHLGMSGSQAAERAVELLKLVGIPNTEERLKQYPHQFSGGMRQRVDRKSTRLNSSHANISYAVFCLKKKKKQKKESLKVATDQHRGGEEKRGK